MYFYLTQTFTLCKINVLFFLKKIHSFFRSHLLKKFSKEEKNFHELSYPQWFLKRRKERKKIKEAIVSPGKGIVMMLPVEGVAWTGTGFDGAVLQSIDFGSTNPTNHCVTCHLFAHPKNWPKSRQSHAIYHSSSQKYYKKFRWYGEIIVRSGFQNLSSMSKH